MKYLLLSAFIASAFSVNAQEVPPPPPPPVLEIEEVEGEEEIMEVIELETEMPESAVEDEVFTIVEEMPEFPGGNDAMYAFINENINYPEEAQKDKIQGVVYVKFIVRKDGSIDENVNVVRGVHPLLDTEAQRVVRSMPDWKPGMQRGKPVSVYFTLPIRFKL